MQSQIWLARAETFRLTPAEAGVFRTRLAHDWRTEAAKSPGIGGPKETPKKICQARA